MKILHINTLFKPHGHGGAEVFLERLSTQLVDRGHQVRVACLRPPKRDEPVSHQGDEQLRVYEFSLRNTYWPFDGAPRGWLAKGLWHFRNSFSRGGAEDIAALVEHEKPDIVHTHNLSGFTSAVWQAVPRAVPLVHTIHDYALLCPSTTMFRRNDNCAGQCLSCKLMSLPKPRQSSSVGAVVGVSRFVLERHVSAGYFTHARQYVIHNGDPRPPRSSSVNRPQARAFRVGYLGRLAPSKGVDFMLDALAPLAGQCELLVAGSGDPEYEKMLKRRHQPRGVVFVGQVDAARFLDTLDLLVVPSRWHEPFGLVLCEGLSAGVPVVAARVGGIPEIFEHGTCGFLFDPSDVSSLRGYVARLVGDRQLYRQMSQASRRQAEAYQFHRTVDEYERLYDELLN